MFYNRNLERAAKYLVASVRQRFGCQMVVLQGSDDRKSSVPEGRYTYSPGIELKLHFEWEIVTFDSFLQRM